MDGDKFYTSRAWRRVRDLKIKESGGVCARCGRVFTDTSKLIVHHKNHLKKDDYTNPAKAFDDSNLEVICFDCHNKEHDRFKFTKNVYIVYGAPFSGKKTYVYANKEVDDLVVDMDLLYSALTMEDVGVVKPECLRFNVFKVRDCLIDMIKTRYGNWRNAWIIGGYANQFDLEDLQRKVNATSSIFIQASKETCLERLQACLDGRDKNKWRIYIERWFDEYTPH